MNFDDQTPITVASDNSEEYQKIQIPYGSEDVQFGRLRIPPDHPGPYPVVMLIHGGFWRTAYGFDLMTPLARDLTKKGFATWNIEYRRVGEPGGGWPGTLHDVANAADALRSLGPTYALNLNQVVTLGHSAGGHLALWLAARHRLTQPGIGGMSSESYNPLPLVGAVSLAGVADLKMAWELDLGNSAANEVMGGSPELFPERYAFSSPAELLPLGIPQVLVHGGADDSVPLAMSQRYAQRARDVGDPVHLIELPGVDHFALINPTSQAWELTVEALKNLLGF